ncbi:uncharacterized protein LOC144450797 [Glandiceps talaboti]
MASWIVIWGYTLVCAIVYMLSLVMPGSCLSCYVCGATDSIRNCTMDLVSRECPFGYDSCFTETLYNASNEFNPERMTKDCITGASCEDRIKKHHDECVEKISGREEDIVCVKCCTGQRCNKSASSNVTIVIPSLTVVLLAVASVVALATPCVLSTQSISPATILPFQR